MKRLLLVMLFILSLCFVGCGNKAAEDNKQVQTPKQEEAKEDVKSEPIKEEPKQEEVKQFTEDEQKQIKDLLEMCATGVALEGASFTLNVVDQNTMEIHVVKNIYQLESYYKCSVTEFVPKLRHSKALSNIPSMVFETTKRKFEKTNVYFYQSQEYLNKKEWFTTQTINYDGTLF